MSKYQSPAQGIMQTADFGDAQSYKVACSCGHTDHNHDVWIELEPDINEISVTVYTHVASHNNRWRLIWQLLTQGYIKLETSLLLNEQQALNYAETVKRSVKQLKLSRKNNE